MKGFKCAVSVEKDGHRLGRIGKQVGGPLWLPSTTLAPGQKEDALPIFLEQMSLSQKHCLQ